MLSYELLLSVHFNSMVRFPRSRFLPKMMIFRPENNWLDWDILYQNQFNCLQLQSLCKQHKLWYTHCHVVGCGLMEKSLIWPRFTVILLATEILRKTYSLSQSMNMCDHDLKLVPHSAAITKSRVKPLLRLMYRAVFCFPDKTQFDRS